jgi:hypothetical protein
MKTDTTKAAGDVADEKLFDNWFDPVETGLRAKVRGFMETMIEEELDTALSRPRYGRRLELTARIRRLRRLSAIGMGIGCDR